MVRRPSTSFWTPRPMPTMATSSRSGTVRSRSTRTCSIRSRAVPRQPPRSHSPGTRVRMIRRVRRIRRPAVPLVGRYWSHQEAIREPTPGGTPFTVTVKDPGPMAALLAPLDYIRNDMTGQVLTFWSILISILLYVTISLAAWAAGRPAHDMDKLLNRGVHAVKGDQATVISRGTWLERIWLRSAR